MLLLRWDCFEQGVPHEKDEVHDNDEAGLVVDPILDCKMCVPAWKSDGKTRLNAGMILRAVCG